jgi:hypothetical protein
MNKINICKKCRKRKFNLQTGVLCSLTNEKPTFEDSCPDFELDETIKEKQWAKLRPNDKRSKAVLTLIKIVLLLEVVSIISSGMQYSLLSAALNGGEISMEEANANDFREQVIAILHLLAYLVSGITFIMWFRRAYFNLHLNVKHLEFSEGWAAGSWFVPILNLYRPLQIMKELYFETKKLLSIKEPLTEFELTDKFLGVWWMLWIINGIFGQIVSSFTDHAETVSTWSTVTILKMIDSLLGIGLALVTIQVIKDYSNAERILIKHEQTSA